MRPTCVVVDDHESFRRMVGRLLDASGVNVVAEASGVDSAVAAVVVHRPDLLLLDVLLLDGSALDVIGRLKSMRPLPRLLVTSSRGLDEHDPALHAYPFITKSDLTVERVRDWVAGG